MIDIPSFIVGVVIGALIVIGIALIAGWIITDHNVDDDYEGGQING